jgi:hypothetical protein
MLTHFKRLSRVLSVSKGEEKGARDMVVETVDFKLHPRKGWRKSQSRKREEVRVNVDNWEQKPYVGLEEAVYEVMGVDTKPRPAFVRVSLKDAHKYRTRWRSAA